MDSRRVVFVLIILMLIIAGMVFYAALPRLIPPDSMPADDTHVETPAPIATTSSQPSPDAPLSRSVTIESPASGAKVGHAFSIAGKAPGPWYFEATFPIIVTDAAGNKIATSHGQAQGDWMTNNLVAFTAHIDVGTFTGPATVNLLRDNPSGLPENDDSVALDIVIQ